MQVVCIISITIMNNR